MKNCIILGSGRSGTSLTSGLFSLSNYFMGEELWEARNSNPRGFFEDREINKINEDILVPAAPKPIDFMGRSFFKNKTRYWDRWLAQVPLNTNKLANTIDIDQRIKKIISHSPYCLKDPRFSYTLPIWQPHFTNEVYIVVFRHPGDTALSLIKECQSVDRLKNYLQFDINDGLQLWFLIYQHIFKHYQDNGNWLFVHYNQLLDHSVYDKLEELTQCPVDRSFSDPKLHRSHNSDISLKKSTARLYQRLCLLANYS